MLHASQDLPLCTAKNFVSPPTGTKYHSCCPSSPIRTTMEDTHGISSSRRRELEEPLTLVGNATTLGQEGEESLTSFVSGLRIFFFDSFHSKAVLPSIAIMILFSFSVGLTVGIIPEEITDRYARLHHGYGSSVASSPPCWHYDNNTMPSACKLGGDDAQAGSAYSMLAQNLLTFFLSAIVGSYSDVKGRKPFVMVSISLFVLEKAALVAIQLNKGVDPVWYYAASASQGAVSTFSLFFALLSDGCPAEQRAGRFAMFLAAFYIGFSVAPSLAMFGSHLAISWWALGLIAINLVVCAVFLPETLPEPAAATTMVAMGEATVGSPTEDMVSGLLSLDGDESESENENECTESELYIEEMTNHYYCCQAPLALLLRPFREMTILARDRNLQMLALASFLSAAVYNTDISLIVYYVEEHLNVRENDLAFMFLLQGILGVILQGIGLQPLVYALGEKGLLVLTFVSGTVHNFLYGIATNKTTITIALNLSQITKLNYPLLSSLASQRVGPSEQGLIQGALMGLNALAGAVGPVSMNWIYQQTKNGTTHDLFGPGTMFLLAAGLYLLGTVVVSLIPSPRTGTTVGSSNRSEIETDNDRGENNSSSNDNRMGGNGYRRVTRNENNF